MTMCVQEKERLVTELGESVMLTIVWRKNKNEKPDKSQATTSRVNQKGKGKVLPYSDIKKNNKCFFCKNKGHDKDCTKYKKLLEKKGNLSSFVCNESNMTNVNINTWWTDFESTIHIVNSL